MLGRKQPGETLPFTYDFRGELAGDTIAAIISATSAPRNGGANLAKAAEASLDGIVTIHWQGGADGESYLTTVQIEPSSGGVLEMSGEIAVEAAAFQVPIISTAYLSADEYVARFGREETIRLTDESRMGQIDAARLQAALEDATEYAEGFLRLRYALPLASPPASIKGIVAALAREALHKTRVTDAVIQAATRARSDLKELAAGRMVLALLDGAEPDASAIGQSLAVWGASADAIVFNADKLAGF